MWIGIYKPYSGGPISTTVYVGDTSNANMTLGLTINQGAADNEILALKSSDVAHTVTTDTEADTYALIKKYSATAGGTLLRGLTDSDAEGALVLEGIIGSTNPTDTNAALLLIGSKQTGTTTAALGATETVLKIYNRTTSLITLMGDGDLNIGTRISLHGGTNDDGIVFGDLGTATKGIDFSASGLSGATDYWIYNNSTNYWGADGSLSETYIYAQSGIYSNIIGNLTAGKDLVISSGGFENVSFHSTKDQSSPLFGNSTRIGSLSLCSSNGTATITKTTHGLTLAVGELVHVTGSSTVADKGFYRIVSSTENTIVVDRVLSGTQSNVALTVYKDVISMHATDATNGQMLTSWSAQNKPMQIGGTVLAATGHSLTSKDILISGNYCEVDALIYADAGIDVASGQVYKLNNVQVVGARVVDERADDVIEAAHDALYPLAGGLLDALRDAMIAHGLIAAA